MKSTAELLFTSIFESFFSILHNINYDTLVDSHLHIFGINDTINMVDVGLTYKTHYRDYQQHEKHQIVRLG
jgi:hypothetical protein